jgi:hypothetical protein
MRIALEVMYNAQFMSDQNKKVNAKTLKLAGASIVEAKFRLFEKEVKMRFRHAVVAAEDALGLAPEVLDPVDVIVAFVREQSDGDRTRRRRGRHKRVTVGINYGLRHNPLTDDRKESVLADIGDHHGVDLAAALEDTKDRDLAGRAAAAPAFPNTAKTALIHLDEFRRPAGPAGPPHCGTDSEALSHQT